MFSSIEADWRRAPLSPKRRVMVDYAVKLTRSPGAVDSADVDSLRHVGFTDRDVLDIVEVVAYYAYANRVADGLGIEVEGWISDDA